MTSDDSKFAAAYYENEPYQFSQACLPEDIVCLGSDSEETQEETSRKHQRYEEQAKRCAAGILPTLQSTSLRGPLSRESWTWKNPWRYIPANIDGGLEEDLLEADEDEDQDLGEGEDEDLLDRSDVTMGIGMKTRQGLEQEESLEDWWHPGTEMLFTRENVMRWAAVHGLGHLHAPEALKRCKAAAAEEAVRKDSVQDQILTSVEQDDRADAGSIPDDLDIERDHEFPAASLISTRPQDGPIVTDDYDQSSNLDQYTQNTSGQRSKKRRRDSKWLRGSYVSKRARWDDEPVSSPTPLPNVFLQHHQQRLERGSLQGHEDEHFRHAPAENIIIPPLLPPKCLKVQSRARYALDLPSVEGGLNSFTGDQFAHFEENIEGLDELSGNSQDPGPIILSSTTETQMRRASNVPDRSFSDLEEDDLVVITPKSSVKTPSKSRNSIQHEKPSSLKLPKLRSGPELVDEESFVTEVAPSSRNVEKFKFRKKRRRTNDESPENAAAPKRDLIVTTSDPIVKNQYPPSKENGLTKRSGVSACFDLTVHSELENDFVNGGSSSPTSDQSKVNWDMLNKDLQSPCRDAISNNSFSETSAFNAQPTVANLPRMALSHSPRSESCLRNPFPPRLPSLTTSPTKGVLPVISRPVASLNKARPHRNLLYNAVSLASKSIKTDLMECVLPKFDWEDAAEIEMDKTQLSLSQSFPSSSKKSPEDFKTGSSLIHKTTPTTTPQARIDAIHIQDGKSLSFDDVMSLSESQNLLSPAPILPRGQEPRVQSARIESQITNRSAQHTYLSPESKSRLPHHRSRSSEPLDTQELPLIASGLPKLSNGPQIPVSSLDQNVISTQSYNTSPLKSQRSSAVVREESPGREKSLASADILVGVVNRQAARAGLPQGPVVTEQVNYTVQELFIDADERQNNEDILGVDVSVVTSSISYANIEESPLTIQNISAADDDQQKPSKAIARYANIKNVSSSNNHLFNASDESWEGCGPQSPWVAEPSQPLAFLTRPKMIVDLLSNDTENERMPPVEIHPEQMMGDLIWPITRNLSAPKGNTITSNNAVETPKPNSQSSKARINDEWISSEKPLSNLTRNPWMSCLKNKATTKAKKRVSFSVSPSNRTGTSESAKSLLRARSPPPQAKVTYDEDSHEEDTLEDDQNEKRFIGPRRFTQILPDHIHSQEVLSSPALGAQAEAFIAADRKASLEQEHVTATHDSPLRFLQPRSEASDNAIWGDRDEQPSFRMESPERSTINTMPDFNMEKALGEIGEFLGGDWSVDAEIKKAKDSIQTSTPIEDTSYRRRRLFGLV